MNEHQSNFNRNPHHADGTDEDLRRIQELAVSPQTEANALEAERLLRSDARTVEVPERVHRRLRRSIEQLGPGQRSWWKRLFRRGRR